MDYTMLTDAELEAENQKEMAIRAESGARSEQIIAEYSKRKQQRRAERLAAGMTDAEKKTLARVLVPPAAVAAEAVAPGEEA